MNDIQILIHALISISTLDARNSTQGFNEWGEAEMFHKARALATEALVEYAKYIVRESAKERE